jgi:hypothetical protein
MADEQKNLHCSLVEIFLLVSVRTHFHAPLILWTKADTGISHKSVHFRLPRSSSNNQYHPINIKFHNHLSAPNHSYIRRVSFHNSISLVSAVLFMEALLTWRGCYLKVTESGLTNCIAASQVASSLERQTPSLALTQFDSNSTGIRCQTNESAFLRLSATDLIRRLCSTQFGQYAISWGSATAAS